MDNRGDSAMAVMPARPNGTDIGIDCGCGGRASGFAGRLPLDMSGASVRLVNPSMVYSGKAFDVGGFPAGTAIS